MATPQAPWTRRSGAGQWEARTTPASHRPAGVEGTGSYGYRHRLNRGGDRAANNALWVIANVRLGSDPRTQAFLAKRTATGNSRKEIMRMLQRYIARELYPLIIDALRPAAIDGLTQAHQ